MDQNNNNWKTSNDEFRGYTKAMLVNIHDDVKEIKDAFIGFGADCRERHIRVDKKISKLGKKVAALGASVAIILTILGYLLRVHLF